MLTINVAIATLGAEGIIRVSKMLPPEKPGVKYIISWQQYDEGPQPKALLERKDVQIYKFDGVGLSANRNNAVSKCNGDIILIADDDITYYPDFILKLRETYENDSDLDLAIFKVDFPYPKNYPDKDCRLTLPLPKNYYCSSIEISFRSKIKEYMKFYEDMGLGTGYMQCGEDELFLYSALKKGYNCNFVSKTIAIHEDISSGHKISKGILRGQGFVIAALYPGSFFIRIPLKAYRLMKEHKIKFWWAFKGLREGALRKIFNWDKITIECRW